MLKKIIKFLFEDYHRPSAKLLHFKMIIKKIFYNKQTNLFSERSMLLKEPPKNLIYYNKVGRLYIMIMNFLFIILFNKYFENEANLNDKNMQKLSNGSDAEPWPVQAAHHFDDQKDILNNNFQNLLQENYFNSIDLLKSYPVFKENTWWKNVREEFINLFFLENKINLNKIINFRNNINTKAEILNDQNYLSKINSERVKKLKSVMLINLYHKLSTQVSLDVLRLSSDSKVGNNQCLNYRGQRINQRILRYGYFLSQIRQNTSLDSNDKNLFLDLGGGYGGLARMIKNLYPNSTIVIIELPELCMLSNYFLQTNFNEKSIGTFKDFKDSNKINEEDLKKFDFVILPQFFIEKFERNIFDITINTMSLGEITDEMQDFYLKNIERITKKYFYSVNRSKKRVEKYNSRGFYDLKFNSRWLAKIYKYTHTYHIEFLGEKK